MDKETINFIYQFIIISTAALIAVLFYSFEGYLFAILVGAVALIENREKNKKIEQLEKNWKFCKSLLDDARSVLTEEQKEKLNYKL